MFLGIMYLGKLLYQGGIDGRVIFGESLSGYGGRAAITDCCSFESRNANRPIKILPSVIRTILIIDSVWVIESIFESESDMFAFPQVIACTCDGIPL